MHTVPDALSLDNMILRYATCHGEPGYALRSEDRRVFFIGHDAGMTQLSDADAPHLVLLGAVDICERQHLLDAVHGYAWTACHRAQEAA
jgi:hypothetical protein